MSSQADFIQGCDAWIRHDGPMHHSVVSSRARYARNLQTLPFAPRASREKLAEIVQKADAAISSSSYFQNFRRIAISEVNSLHRLFMKESHIISTELEQGGENRVIFVSPDYRISIMINEEDHIRMQCLDVGFQIEKAHSIIEEVQAELSRLMDFAYSERFGYLTACPTNVGTALRLSVMLHLPGLVLINRVEEILQSVSQYGLTVRGIYGEHSENLGDFFQISNEVTLGKTREELMRVLKSVTEQIVQRETQARDALFEQKPRIVKDMLSRALSTLKSAWIIDSAEALAHLSKIRLGIDQGYFHPFTHADLNRLMVEVQPAHLQCRQGSQLPEEQRDGLRAQILHQRLKSVSYN
jgi:protein arginine kinase